MEDDSLPVPISRLSALLRALWFIAAAFGFGWSAVLLTKLREEREAYEYLARRFLQLEGGKRTELRQARPRIKDSAFWWASIIAFILGLLALHWIGYAITGEFATYDNGESFFGAPKGIE